MKLFHSHSETKDFLDSSQLAKFLSKSSNRYHHTLGVVRSMKNLLSYLHDIGYSPKLTQFHFHPLDGVIYAAQRNFPKPVVATVLFHSCAYELAKVENHSQIISIYQEHLPLLDQQDHKFIDWVTYCDLHTSPTGEKITFQERFEEILHRYAPHHKVSQMMQKNKGYYEELISKVHQFMQAP